MSNLSPVILNEIKKVVIVGASGFSTPMNGTLAINSTATMIDSGGATYLKTGYTSSDPVDLAAYPDAEVTSGSIGVALAMFETVSGNQSGRPLYTRIK